MRSILGSILVNSGQSGTHSPETSWKPHGNLIKNQYITSHKPVKRPCKPVIRLITVYNRPGTRNKAVFYTPRFSYKGPETAVGSGTSVSWVHWHGWYWVGTGRGYTGVLPTQHAAKPSRRPVTAGNGPSLLGGSDAGWAPTGEYGGGGDGYDPPFGPGRSSTAGPPWSYPRRMPPPGQ